MHGLCRLLFPRQPDTPREGSHLPFLLPLSSPHGCPGTCTTEPWLKIPSGKNTISGQIGSCNQKNPLHQTRDWVVEAWPGHARIGDFPKAESIAHSALLPLAQSDCETSPAEIKGLLQSSPQPVKGLPSGKWLLTRLSALAPV